ncbi:hypothetical protein BDK61_2391 [Haloarcula quadrata]|uniref:Uncharacterized protein n=1 Tax=Haloarcula quadrata TaxID=182779 RepID=A0A495R6X9_9EURY|nr:hypothetical protein [Haloarcula quadrata]RKS83063.1 hypothetical protein BDK61_2391 [Haloarcula quadrata]
MSSGIFRDADGTYNKRLLGLVLLLLLAVIGAGVGTLGLTDSSDSAPDQPTTEMTPSPTESTPTETPDGTDSTPTESGGSGSPPPSSLLTETPTSAPNQSAGNTTSNTTAE